MSDLDSILNEVGQDVKNMEEQFKTARDLIDLMKAAGEDVTEMESDYRTLQVQKGKWKRALIDRGVEA